MRRHIIITIAGIIITLLSIFLSYEGYKNELASYNNITGKVTNVGVYDDITNSQMLSFEYIVDNINYNNTKNLTIHKSDKLSVGEDILLYVSKTNPENTTFNVGMSYKVIIILDVFMTVFLLCVIVVMMKEGL